MIRFDSVSKKFGKKNILDKIDFHVNEFDLCALVGNNGSGKTSIIRILCNLLPQSSGDVFIKGVRLSSNYVSYKNDFGIILSTPYFIKEFNTLDYLSFVGKFQKVEKSLLKNRINDLIELLSIENLDSKIELLSSGAQMKVSIAAALIHNPSVLILDEPFVNLDIIATQKIISLLKKFRGKKTLIITSHDLQIITELCNKVLILEKGKIIAQIDNPNFDSIDFKAKINDFLIQNSSELVAPNWLK